MYESNFPLEYLVGVLNSKALAFIYEQFFGSLRMSGGYLQFQAPQLRALPVPILESEQVLEISNHVSELQKHADQIIDIKRDVIGLLVADFGLSGTSRKLGAFETLTW